jgi:DNA-binding ferritin-like protein
MAVEDFKNKVQEVAEKAKAKAPKPDELAERAKEAGGQAKDKAEALKDQVQERLPFGKDADK